ncbi:OmpA family protein [Sulfurimonas sp.]|uniref:OmpA family protein n=1 Tax=Sulfurimonas sp. TaxID=2022749 RepID=UPI00356B4B02
MKYIVLTLLTFTLLLLNASEVDTPTKKTADEFTLIQPIAVEEAPQEDVIEDIDGDGVLSDIDKCQDTKKGVKVGPDGCKLKNIIVLLKGQKDNSSIVVATGVGNVVVDKPNQFVSISSKDDSPTEPKNISKDDLNALFSGVISEIPEKQLSYTLYFNGIKLTDESKISLQTMINEVSQRDKPYIQIIGHTDTAGSSEKNKILGLKRAKAVYEMINNSDISYAKIDVDSYSESNLAIKTEDKTVEQLNRRVEVFVH